jgi:hypothetical protein
VRYAANRRRIGSQDEMCVSEAHSMYRNGDYAAASSVQLAWRDLHHGSLRTA